MCNLCEQWGHGEKWYLNRENHRKYEVGSEPDMEAFLRAWGGDFHNWQLSYERLSHLEGVKDHQVVPLEDVLEMFDIVGDIAQGDPKAFAIGNCPCAITFTGEKVEKCISFGMSLAVSKSRMSAAEESQRHFLTLEEAKAKVVEFDRKGYVHSPDAIGSIFSNFHVMQICNCTASSCTRFRMRDQGHSSPIKGEYIAAINPLECSGCRRCLSYCQFGALRFDPTNRKAWVDVRACAGCGVCRVQCESGAISLLDRAKIPAAANLW